MHPDALHIQPGINLREDIRLALASALLGLSSPGPTPDDPPAVLLKNVANDFFVKCGNVNNKINLVDALPANRQRQLWYFQPAGEGAGYLVSMLDQKKVLDRKNGLLALIAYERDGGKNQLWRMHHIGNGIHVIESVLDGKVLEAKDAGTDLVDAPRVDEAKQRWRTLPP